MELFEPELDLVFDTETTGMLEFKLPIGHPKQPHIVQLGALLQTKEGRVLGELNFLIKPDGWTIPTEASEIHGITTEDCEKYGIPLRAALGVLNMWLAFKPLLVAHNFTYDFKVTEGEVKRLGRPPIFEGLPSYCTMQASTDLVKIPNEKRGGYKWPKLQELHKFLFDVEFDGAHDAMADVRACARAKRELKKRGL